MLRSPRPARTQRDSSEIPAGSKAKAFERPRGLFLRPKGLQLSFSGSFGTHTAGPGRRAAAGQGLSQGSGKARWRPPLRSFTAGESERLRLPRQPPHRTGTRCGARFARRCRPSSWRHRERDAERQAGRREADDRAALLPAQLATLRVAPARAPPSVVSSSSHVVDRALSLCSPAKPR